ncbi:E3 ubiquitin-protein ligase uhrf1 [Entomophthora muscae]|nr:E3 ubiquitin-protein ligase uhrf1 [Entomophthora muscae]
MMDMLQNINKNTIDEPSSLAAPTKKKPVSSNRGTIPPFRFNCSDCTTGFNPECRQHNCQTCHQRVGDFNALICRSCENAYHIACLAPPLVNIFELWSCAACKQYIVDLGDRPVYTGKIPGILVGSSWSFRIQMSENGLHRPSIAGIHGSGGNPAYSIVLQGGYEKDEDFGEYFYYTGAGGRDIKDRHFKDQELLSSNLSLAASCDSSLNPLGGRARDWQKSAPIRVIRGPKLLKHSPRFAPTHFRYDGIYKLVEYWPERIAEGFLIWRFHLRRDDVEPAPWTPEGEEYIKNNNIVLEFMETSKRSAPTELTSPKIIIENKFTQPLETVNPSKRPCKAEIASSSEPQEADLPSPISAVQPIVEPTHHRKLAILDPLIALDVRNRKFWDQVRSDAQLDFIQFLDKIRQQFECVICSDLVESTIPYTTVCGHTFCRPCFRGEVRQNLGLCPKCLNHLPDINLEENVNDGNNALKIQVNEALANILLLLKPALDEEALRPSMHNQ